MGQLSVVTGGGGFVGRHLVASLVERGDEVRVLDIVEPEELDAEFRKVDITDAAAVRDALEGAECVFHNASLVHTKHNRAELVQRVNLDGTRHVLEACRAHGWPSRCRRSSSWACATRSCATSRPSPSCSPR